MTLNKQTTGTPEKKTRCHPIQRWLFRVTVLLFILITLFIVSLPIAISNGAGREILLHLAEEVLATPCTIDEVEMDWSGGFALKGVRLDQPTGFGAGPAIVLEEAKIDLALGKLFKDKIKVNVEVRGLKITVTRNGTNQINLEQLLKSSIGRNVESSRIAQKTEVKISRQKALPEKSDKPLPLLLYLSLRGSEINLIDMANGTSGKIAMSASATNADYGMPIRWKSKFTIIKTGGEPGGEIALESLAPLDGTEMELSIRGQEISLAALRSMAVTDDGLTSLAGQAKLGIDIRLDGNKVTSQGKVEIFHLAAAMKELGPVPIRQEKITLHTDFACDLAQEKYDLAGVKLICDTLQVRPLSPEEVTGLSATKEAIGLETIIDLAKCPRHPQLLPKGAEITGQLTLRVAGSIGDPGEISFQMIGAGITYEDEEIYAGKISLAGTGSIPPEPCLTTILADLTLAADSVKQKDNELTTVNARVNLAGGKATINLDQAIYNDGKAQATVILTNLEKAPFADLQCSIQDAKVNQSLAPLLTYFLPFAITPDDAALAGKISLQTNLRGEIPSFESPEMNLENELAGLKGKGSIALTDLVFTGTPALKNILTTFRHQGLHLYKNLNTYFRIDGGRIIQDGIKIRHKDANLIIRGTTTFNGQINYTFDCQELLGKHKDGRKLLSTLGSSLLPVSLGGTINNPKPEVKKLDLNQLLEKGTKEDRKNLQKKLDKAIQKGLDKLFGKKRK